MLLILFRNQNHGRCHLNVCPRRPTGSPSVWPEPTLPLLLKPSPAPCVRRMLALRWNGLSGLNHDRRDPPVEPPAGSEAG